MAEEKLEEPEVGSSPRVWGILQWWVQTRGPIRFIPTRVGNTSSGVMTTTSGSVHPHACGEYPSSGGLDHHHGGSSPRVWGIPQLGFYEAGPARFIPTRVGNTSIM